MAAEYGPNTEMDLKKNKADWFILEKPPCCLASRGRHIWLQQDFENGIMERGI